MKKTSTVFLRIATSVIWLGVTAITLYTGSSFLSAAYTYPDNSVTALAFGSILYLITIFFTLGIVKAWQTLSLIDRKQVFSTQTVRSVQSVTLCAVIVSALFIAALPFVYIWADHEDAPGLIIINLFFVGITAVVAVAMSLIQRLLAEAVSIKSENDLTV